MTFDPEPDLDNANVGMPERISGTTSDYRSYQTGSSLFIFRKEVMTLIKVNGEMQDVNEKSVLEYLLSEGYDTKRIAIELNGSILPGKDYESTMLNDGDSIEIVCFVGGG